MTEPSVNGTVTLEGEVTTLTFVRRLHHPVEAVWAAITDSDQRARWVGPTIIDAHRGGRIETDPNDPPIPRDAKHMHGRILVWDPPRVLEHEWHQAIVEDGVVRYELVPDGDDTVLTFTHRGLGVSNASGFLSGTHAYLDRLAALLDGDELPDWRQRYTQVQLWPTPRPTRPGTGVGYGTLAPGVANVAMRDVPAGVSGAASGVLSAARQVGTSVGLAVLGAIGVAAATAAWSARLGDLPASLRPAATQQGHHVAGGQIGAVTTALGGAARDAAVASFLHGYRLAGGAAGCVLLAGIAAALGLRNASRSPAAAAARDARLASAGTPRR